MGDLTVIKTDSGEIKLSPKIIKDCLVRGNGKIDDQEAMMFLSLCKFQKLNPFLNEAYLVKFGSSPANIIVGKEAFTKRAYMHPKFKGLTAGIIVERDGEILELEGSFKKPSDILLGGWAIVHVADRVPFKNTVSMEEYSKGQSTWKQIPCTMIRKVALVQALREAFPEYFQAMYSQEEMPVDNDVVDGFEAVTPPQECVVEEQEIKLVTTAQIKRMFTIAGKKQLTNEQVKEMMQEMFSIESSKEMNVEQYEVFVELIERIPDVVEGEIVDSKEDK
jgi:phage recombination protein Bet